MLENSPTNFIEHEILTKQHYQLSLTKDIHKANFVILPYSWEHYYQNKLFHKLDKIVDFVKRFDKKLIAITHSDYGYQPYMEQAITFRWGGYKSKNNSNQFCLPNFFNDPVEFFYNNQSYIRTKQPFPSIGFCGKANANVLTLLIDITKTIGHNLQYQFYKYNQEPQTIFPTPNLIRIKTLKAIENSPNIIHNFKKRRKFYNGLATANSIEQQNHISTLEFYENIRNTDYTLCMRGAGNFSIRFCQVLAMGRIPIFVNTDCNLPFDTIIPWREIIPWIEYEELDNLSEKVVKFHQYLSHEGFKAKQIQMREIWKQYFTSKGFFKNLNRLLLYPQ